MKRLPNSDFALVSDSTVITISSALYKSGIFLNMIYVYCVYYNTVKLISMHHALDLS